MNATQNTVAGETVEQMKARLWTLRMAGGRNYAARAQLGDAIRRAERANPPAPPAPTFARCCAAGVVAGGCTCSYVVRCPIHGEKHHGTHD